MTATGAPSTVVLDRTEIHDDGVSALVLRCGGEIDSLNAPALTAAIVEGLTRISTGSSAERRLLLVDLREVSFFGASAVTALLLGADSAPPGAALSLIVGDTRPVLIVVNALDLRASFSIHHDLPEALLPRI